MERLPIEVHMGADSRCASKYPPNRGSKRSVRYAHDQTEAVCDFGGFTEKPGHLQGECCPECLRLALGFSSAILTYGLTVQDQHRAIQLSKIMRLK
jgi:hypothetical protein